MIAPEQVNAFFGVENDEETLLKVGSSESVSCFKS
jgi:hypothetical protein